MQLIVYADEEARAEAYEDLVNRTCSAEPQPGLLYLVQDDANWVVALTDPTLGEDLVDQLQAEGGRPC